MEEKKKSSSILTVLCVILIMLAIAVIGVLFYQNNELRKLANNLDESTKNTNVSYNNQNSVNNEQKSISSETKSNSNDEVKISSKEDVIALAEKAEAKEFCKLELSSLKKAGKKYLATADYIAPDILTEEEYRKMVKDGQTEIDGQKFIFKNDNIEDSVIYNIGYGYLLLDDSEKEYDENGDEIRHWVYGYNIEKTEDGYVLFFEIGGVYSMPVIIKESISFYLDGDTILYFFPSGGETTLKVRANELTEEKIRNSDIRIKVDPFENEIIISEDMR